MPCQEMLTKTLLQQKQPSIKQGITVVKTAALMLILVFLIVSCVSTAHLVSSVSEDSWVTKEPIHNARMRLGVAVVNEKIYAIGDDDLSLTSNVLSPEMGYGKVLSTNEEYDPATGTWTFKTSMPTPRTSFGIAVYKNKIYCIGGYIGNGSVTAVNEAYDPDSDSWTTKTSAPLDITSLGSTVFNNQIYFITTRSTEENPAQGGLILTYDPLADRWSIGKPSPTYGSACAIGVASGANDSKGIYFFDESATYKYDPITENWTNYTSMPTARGYAGAAVLNDKFYVIGGIFAPYEGYIVMTNSATTNEQNTPIGYGAPDLFTPSPSPTTSSNALPSPTATSSPEPASTSEHFLTILVVVASVASGVVVTCGLLFYFKKRKR